MAPLGLLGVFGLKEKGERRKEKGKSYKYPFISICFVM